MAWEAAVTLSTLCVVLLLLASSRFSADWVLMAALAFLLLIGVLTPAAALAGFANPGVITIATLYIVAAALKETGAVQWIARSLLGHPATVRGALSWMLLPIGMLSALLSWSGLSAWLALLLIYALTSTFTEVITNNAAAVLMFPIALSVASSWTSVICLLRWRSCSRHLPVSSRRWAIRPI